MAFVAGGHFSEKWGFMSGDNIMVNREDGVYDKTCILN